MEFRLTEWTGVFRNHFATSPAAGLRSHHGKILFNFSFPPVPFCRHARPQRAELNVPADVNIRQFPNANARVVSTTTIEAHGRLCAHNESAVEYIDEGEGCGDVVEYPCICRTSACAQ